MLTISQVARKLGINIQTIYFYEKKGLISTVNRSESGYRLFTVEDVEIISFIIRNKKLGLTLEEIRELLNLQKNNNLSCGEVYQRLEKKITQINQQIEELTTLKNELLPLLNKAKLQQEQQSCQIFS
jgi:MerR family transcriptional regulator, Zn(II)-responsive regulator of zntA